MSRVWAHMLSRWTLWWTGTGDVRGVEAVGEKVGRLLQGGVRFVLGKDRLIAFHGIHRLLSFLTWTYQMVMIGCHGVGADGYLYKLQVMQSGR